MYTACGLWLTAAVLVVGGLVVLVCALFAWGTRKGASRILALSPDTD